MAMIPTKNEVSIKANGNNIWVDLSKNLPRRVIKNAKRSGIANIRAGLVVTNVFQLKFISPSFPGILDSLFVHLFFLFYFTQDREYRRDSGKKDGSFA